MELVSKKMKVLADEEQLRNGFKYKGECSLRARLPSPIQEKNKREDFFFFDKDYNLIQSISGRLFLKPDEEIFLFRCQVSLSDKKTITGVDFSYRRISFEVDDETRTYFIVGSREFITTSQEITKKIRKVVKIS